MYSSSEDSDSDSGTFKRGKRKAVEDKPVIQQRKDYTRRDEKHDRKERFDTKHEPRDDARVEKHIRRSTDWSEKHSKAQSSSYNAKNVRSRSTRSKSRDRHESKHRPSQHSERKKSPRKFVPKHTTKDSSDRALDTQRTQVHSRSSEEKYREVKKPSPDAKHFRESKHDHSGSVSKKIDPEDYAPAMPRNLKRRSSSPKHTQKSKHGQSKSPNYGSRNYGPSLPKNFELPMETAEFDDHCDFISSEDDSAMIGPVPASAEMSERDLELEKRKIEIKLQQLDRRMEAVNSSDAKHREEWMLELPEIKKVPDMGLSARQFRKNARPDFSDRSSWTKTPNDGHKKSTHGEKSHASTDAAERTRDLERRRDEAQEKLAKEHKKAHKRGKTLLEIHEKLKKKEVRKRSRMLFFTEN